MAHIREAISQDLREIASRHSEQGPEGGPTLTIESVLATSDADTRKAIMNLVTYAEDQDADELAMSRQSTLSRTKGVEDCWVCTDVRLASENPKDEENKLVRSSGHLYMAQTPSGVDEPTYVCTTHHESLLEKALDRYKEAKSQQKVSSAMLEYRSLDQSFPVDVIAYAT